MRDWLPKRAALSTKSSSGVDLEKVPPTKFWPRNFRSSLKEHTLDFTSRQRSASPSPSKSSAISKSSSISKISAQSSKNDKDEKSKSSSQNDKTPGRKPLPNNVRNKIERFEIRFPPERDLNLSFISNKENEKSGTPLVGHKETDTRFNGSISSKQLQGSGDAEKEEKSAQEEPIYVSRRLLFKQKLEEELKSLEKQQGSEEVDVGADDVSTADSWSELEENFSKIYEPVPLHLGMDTWRQMSRDEILSNVASANLKNELRDLNHNEILSKIEHLKDLSFVCPQRDTYINRLKNKSSKEFNVVAQVHRTPQSDSDESLTESALHSKHDAKTILVAANGHCKEDKRDAANDSVSWDTISHDEEGDPVYVSRSEILSRHELWIDSPKRLGINPYMDHDTSNSKSVPKFVSRSNILSKILENETNAVQEQEFDCCSCLSCEECVGSRPPKEDGFSICSSETENQEFSQSTADECTSCDSWSLSQANEDVGSSESCRRGKFNSTLEEQERRLRVLVEAEENRMFFRSLSKDSWSINGSEDEHIQTDTPPRIIGEHPKKMRVKQTLALELEQRVLEILSQHSHIDPYTKKRVLKILREHIQKNYSVDSPADAELKNQEVRKRLRETMASDWETLSNINLGLIYVPMEENSKLVNKLMSKESTDYDTFGSLDSLMFEPKSLSQETLVDISAEKEQQNETLSSSEMSDNKSSMDAVENETAKENLCSDTHQSFNESGENCANAVKSSPSKTDSLSVNESSHSENQVDSMLNEETLGCLANCSPPPTIGRNVCAPQNTENSLGGRSILTSVCNELEVRRNGDFPSQDCPTDRKEGKSAVIGSSVELIKKASLPQFLAQEGFASSASEREANESVMVNFKELALNRQSLRQDDTNSYSDGPYHPDHYGFSLSSQDAASGTHSFVTDDSCSLTSVESVIMLARKKKSDHERKSKGASKKTYIVNKCEESDTNSELDKTSSSRNTNPFLESDTSWDYMDSPTGNGASGASSRSNPSPENASSKAKLDVQFDPRGGNLFSRVLQTTNKVSVSNSRTPTQEKPEEGRALFHAYQNQRFKALLSAMNLTAKNEQVDAQSIYEACDESSLKSKDSPVVLLKHHIYQSLESIESPSPSLKGGALTDASSESGELQVYGSRNGEPIYGAKNSGLYKVINGAHLGKTMNTHEPRNELETLPENKPVVEISVPQPDSSASCAESLQGNLLQDSTTNDDHTLKDVIEVSLKKQEVVPSLAEGNEEDEEGDVIHKETSAFESHPTNTNDKIKKAQKFGISIMGDKNNDLMIRELKLKLRRKFNPETDSQELLESPDERLHKEPVLPTDSDGYMSVALKRSQLAPQVSKILNSLKGKINHEKGANPLAKELPKAPDDSLTNSEQNFDDSTEVVGSEEYTKNDEDKISSSIEDSLASENSSPIWVPTPDYTPFSTLPREEHEKRKHSELDSFYISQDNEDFGFSLSDLEHFIQDHLEKDIDLQMTPEMRKRSTSSNSPKRSVRFNASRMLHELGSAATWSDLESVIFTDETSSTSSSYEEIRLPESRMHTYQEDASLMWKQMSKMRHSKQPEDRERWESQKTKRMLLWMHLSRNKSQLEWCLKSRWWKAKQRASVCWIIQKAHKNKVPSDLQDPYYKDYEGQDHLKPAIVHKLANAEFYCSALANIYGDPNFHNLSHWHIIQALTRKGVYVAEPTDVSLNETVLIQTTPIKMSAHLAVIEAMMALYIREVVIAERVVQAIQRISGLGPGLDVPTPQDQEEALVHWVEYATQALQARVHHAHPNQEQDLPVFPKIQDLSDLSDGIGLAALVAFYCPQELTWEDIAVADPPSMADSLYNIGLVIKFCHDSLPYNPCLLTKEDIVYMHSSVKQNIVAFVSELFFLLELEPVSCVSISSTRKTSTKYIQLSSPGVKPAGVPSVKRSHSMNLNDVGDSRSRAESRSENAPSSHNSDYGGRESSMSDGQDADFVVQRAKGYSTLSDMMRNQSPNPPYYSQHELSHDSNNSRLQAKERYNIESKEEEMGERGRLSRRGSFHGSLSDLNEVPAAGMPSRLEHRALGRSRSRRNSINAEESQLTIENFGGSQDNLNYAARNPDKEPYIHSGKRDSLDEILPRNRSGSRSRSVERRDLHIPSVDVMDNRVIDKLERDALEREKVDTKRINHDTVDSSSESDISYEQEKTLSKATSFKELSRIKEQLPGGINIIYMQQSERDDAPPPSKGHNKGMEKKTTFAALPNQTTWKQQGAVHSQSPHSHADDNKSYEDGEMEQQGVSSELHNVRLQLEEKRKKFEANKRKMEVMANKERQKLGKEAFMQAVVKGDLGTEVSNVSKKWLEDSHADELRTPDIDAMDYDEYHKSLTQMTDSLTELQSDIQRLNQQQQQIQSLMHNGMSQHHPAMQSQSQHGQFYLHDQQQGSPRRMWGQPPSSDGYSSMSPATRRAQWGPARPMMPQGEYMIPGAHPQHGGGYYPYQMGQQIPPQTVPSSHPHQLPPMNQLGSLAPHQHQQQGFTLHGQQAPSLPTMVPQPHHQQQPPIYQNGQGNFYPPSYASHSYGDPGRSVANQVSGSSTPFRLHNEGGPEADQRMPHSLQSSAQSSPSHYPTPQRQQKSPSPSRQITHAPVAAPSPDDMEPQNVCFIESQDHPTGQIGNETPDDKFKRLSISSGSRTYRISHEPGSPTRPTIGTKTFRVPTKKGQPVYDYSDLPEPSPPQRSISPQYHIPESGIVAEPIQDGPKAEKGFYISFDDDSGPKRPKPQLKPKKMAQKKSSPTTPVSTPSGEEPLPIPIRPPRRTSADPMNKLGSVSSLLPRDGSRGSMNLSIATSPTHSSPLPTFASRSDVTLSPSSSTSSLLQQSRLSPWSPPPVSNEEGSSRSPYKFSLTSPHENYREGFTDDPDEDGSSGTLHESTNSFGSGTKKAGKNPAMALVIGNELADPDSSLSEMEKKKERLMMMSMRRKQQQEEFKRKKEMEAELKRQEEKIKEEERQRKKEGEKARRELILERHKVKKAIEEAEKDGRHYTPPAWYFDDSSGTATPTSKTSSVRMRSRGHGGHSGSKPRPKTMHEASYHDERYSSSSSSRGRKGSSHNIGSDTQNANSSSTFLRKNGGKWGSMNSLSRAAGSRGSTGSLSSQDYSSRPYSRTPDQGHTGRRPNSLFGGGGSSTLGSRDRSKSSLYGSRGRDLHQDDYTYKVHEARRPSALPTRSSGNPYSTDSRRRSSSSSSQGYGYGSSPRKYRSTGNLYGQSEHDGLLYHMSEDSGLGRATPPRRAPSPGMSSRHMTSPSGPGSLPPGLFARRRPGTGVFDDNASDISTTSSNMDYCGPRLFKQPAAKSNRPIVLNAVEYCVFPGAVNEGAKKRVLEEIGRSESKHFLILFRDSGCQFRAIYSFNPDNEEVYKLYGTGPKQVTERMYDKFFKYNSGGKCFSEIHTKHLTVTIDAFTIHNSLWQGKRVNLPLKRDMKLVI